VVKLQSILDDKVAVEKIPVHWTEVRTLTLTADKTQASAVELKLRALALPRTQDQRLAASKLIYGDAYGALTLDEIKVAYVKESVAKAQKAADTGIVKIEVSAKHVADFECQFSMMDKEVASVCAHIRACGCMAYATLSPTFVLDQEKVEFEMITPPPSDDVLKSGELNVLPTYAQAVQAKAMHTRVTINNKAPLSFQQKALKSAGAVPPTHPLYNLVPLALITFLYSIFGSAAEKMTVAGKKRVHLAWDGFSGRTSKPSEESLKAFQTGCAGMLLREPPKKFSEVPQIKSRWGNVENNRIPDWLQYAYVRVPDLPTFLEDVKTGKVNETNIAAYHVDPLFQFQVFCGIDAGNINLEKTPVSDWVTQFVASMRNLEKGVESPLNEKQRKKATVQMVSLGEPKRDMIARMFAIPRPDTKTMAALSYVKDSGSLGMMIQKKNGFNQLVGLEEIHPANFSLYPMLKSPLKRYLSKEITGVTWEVKVAALKAEITKEQMLALGQVSGKGKAKPNNRGGKGKPKGNSDKVQPAPALPGVAPAPAQNGAGGARSPPGTCRNFWNSGSCRFGNTCKFKHVANSQSALPGAQPTVPVPAAGPPNPQQGSELQQLVQLLGTYIRNQQAAPQYPPQRPYPNWVPAY
jgi:hypothetical protein